MHNVEKRDPESLWNEYLLFPALWLTRTQVMQDFFFFSCLLRLFKNINILIGYIWHKVAKAWNCRIQKKSLNLFISISLPHSCNGSGPWWFLVAQIQAMRLENAMTQEAGIETSLPCFSFWAVLGFFMFLSLSWKKDSPLVLVPFTLGN